MRASVWTFEAGREMRSEVFAKDRLVVDAGEVDNGDCGRRQRSERSRMTASAIQVICQQLGSSPVSAGLLEFSALMTMLVVTKVCRCGRTGFVRAI